MIKEYCISACFLLISCSDDLRSTPTSSAQNEIITQNMSIVETENVFNRKIKLLRVASSKKNSEIDSNTPLYASNFIDKGVHQILIFNKDKKIINYSQRVIFNATNKTYPKFIKNVEGGMSYADIKKLHFSQDSELLKIAPDFATVHPPDTVCYLYHYKNLTFEFDTNIKLMSVKKSKF